MRRALIVGVGVGLVVVVGGAILLRLDGYSHTSLVARCKTLKLGVSEREVTATLGRSPGAKARVERGAVLIERLFFEGRSVLPNLAAQPIFVDLEGTTGRAVQIVCDEDFVLKGGVIKELEKKGMY